MRYFKRSKFLGMVLFPEFLIDDVGPDEGPSLIIAGRVDRVDIKPYLFPERYNSRLKFHEYGKGIVAWEIADLEGFQHVRLFPRETSAIRQESIIRAMIPFRTRKDMLFRLNRRYTNALAAELDIMEFLFQYYGERVAAMSAYQPCQWCVVAHLAAVEPDVVDTICGAAQAVLDARAHYSCLGLLQRFMRNCESEMRILESWFNISDWEDVEKQWREDGLTLGINPDEHRLFDRIRIPSDRKLGGGHGTLTGKKHDSTAGCDEKGLWLGYRICFDWHRQGNTATLACTSHFLGHPPR